MAEKDPYLSELEEMEETGDPIPAENPDTDETGRFDAGEGAGAQEDSNSVIDLSSDIPVQMTIVMGRKSVTVRDLLDLHTGQVVNLDKLPTDPVDLVAGGKVVGRGELVDVDGRLGVRILKFLK